MISDCNVYRNFLEGFRTVANFSLASIAFGFSDMPAALSIRCKSDMNGGFLTPTAPVSVFFSDDNSCSTKRGTVRMVLGEKRDERVVQLPLLNIEYNPSCDILDLGSGLACTTPHNYFLPFCPSRAL